MNSSDIAAEAFLTKMKELPVEESWLPSIAMIERELRSGNYKYEAGKCILTDSLGMRVKIEDSGKGSGANC